MDWDRVLMLGVHVDEDVEKLIKVYGIVVEEKEEMAVDGEEPKKKPCPLVPPGVDVELFKERIRVVHHSDASSPSPN